METTDADADWVAGPRESDAPPVSAYSTTEERTVFTESGNRDGWIATDLAVEPRR